MFNKIDNHITRVMQKKERYKLLISGMGNETSLQFLQKYKGTDKEICTT